LMVNDVAVTVTETVVVSSAASATVIVAVPAPAAVTVKFTPSDVATVATVVSDDDAVKTPVYCASAAANDCA